MYSDASSTTPAFSIAVKSLAFLLRLPGRVQCVHTGDCAAEDPRPQPSSSWSDTGRRVASTGELRAVLFRSFGCLWRRVSSHA